MSDVGLNKTITKQSIIKKLFVVVITSALAGPIFANPVLDNVAHGNVQVQQSPGNTVVQQNSQQAIINWHSFNIGAGESTHFQQPTGGVALNRINPSQGASQIYGHLSATGKIILINQAGIYFGSSARVDVGGIIASTSDISNENFLAGKYSFNQPGSGSVINRGTITAAEHGLVALVGNNVSNEGVISARGGYVVLASGRKFTVNLSGDNLVNFTVDEGSTSSSIGPDGKPMRNGVNNSGMVVADGGTILMTAKAASGVLDHVINMEGVAQARSVNQVNGEIILSGDDVGVVRVAGTLDASGTGAGQKGGSIKIASKNVLLDNGARLDASGDIGGGAILIGGDYQGKTPISIFGGQQILSNARAVVVMPDTEINASALSMGNGGKVIVWADDLTKFNGKISARGGAISGDGGFVETSGKSILQIINGSVDVSTVNGKAGQWLLDPHNVTISNAASSNINGSFTATGDDAVVNVDVLTGVSGGGGLLTGDVTVSTGAGGAQNGDITVAAPITWATSNTLTLSAANKIFLNSNITATNGGLTLSAANIATGSTLDSTNATITSSSGTAGVTATINVANFILSQGAFYQKAGTLPTFAASNDFEIQGTSIFKRVSGGAGTVGSPYQIGDIYGLQGITSMQLQEGAGLYYQQTNNIDASGTLTWNGGIGWIPLAFYNSPMTFLNLNINYDGQGYVIDGLRINSSASDYNFLNGLGLIGYLNSGNVTNVGVTNANINFNNDGDINLYGSSNYAVLVGNNTGNISNSYATGSLTITGNVAAYIGGLVGSQAGNISNSYTNVTINAVNDSAVGGVVGASFGGNINNVYSMGSITANGNSIGGHSSGGIGGLVGGDMANTTLTNSYSTNSLSGSAQLDGVVGFDSGGNTFSNLFYDSDIYSGSNNTGVGTGLTTSDTQSYAVVSGIFGTTTGATAGGITATPSATSTAPNYTWFMIDGSTRPILMMEHSSTIQTAHQVQMMSAALGGTYQLDQSISMSGTASSATHDVWAGNTFVPIGDSSTAFTGSFNGNNNTISNLTINSSTTDVGLFGYVGGGSYTGEIQNLILSNPSITSSAANATVGALAGTMQGQATTTVLLDNVVVSGGTVQGTYAGSGQFSNVGGLVGTLNTGTLQNVSNSATVSTAQNAKVGGIIGGTTIFDDGGTITNASNSGSLSVGTLTNDPTVNLAGGIAGFISVTSGNTFTISNSNNSGSIIGGTNGILGGLVGQMNGNDIGSFIISNSYNTGNISTSATACGGTGCGTTTSGGILGNAYTDHSLTIINSYNLGNISGNDSAINAGGGFLGGIIGGINSASSSNTITIGGPSTAGAFNAGSLTLTHTSGSNANYAGGLIGFLPNDFSSTTTINIYNSYNTGTVSAAASNVNSSAGGLIGGLLETGVSTNITNSFAAGNVTSGGANGGILGSITAGTATASNVYWNTDTSGLGSASGFGSLSGATGETTSTMMTQGGFSGFNFSGTWGIIANQSFPYLTSIFTSTPRAFSGILGNATGDKAVQLAVNGTNIGTAALTQGVTRTGADGSYYFMEGNGVVADSAPLVIYTTSGDSANAIAIAPTSGGSLANLSAGTNSVGVNAASGVTISYANIASAIGALSSNILLSASSSNLILNSGISFAVASNPIFDLNGNITTSGGGSMSFAGAANLSANSVLNSGSGDISFSSTINGSQTLALNSTGTTTLGGIVGGTTPLTSLTTNAGGTTAINTTGITTTGSQTFNDSVALGADLTLSGGGAFNAGGSINGGAALTLNGFSSAILSGAIGDTTPLTSLTSNATATTISNNITTSGNQAYNNATVQNGINLTSSGGALFLTGNSNSQNWSFSGSNAGSVSGLSSGSGSFGFSGFQNFTAGTGNNTFTFANGASIGGTINGGSTSATNTLNFSTYGSPVTAAFSGNLAGVIKNNSQAQIAGFTQISSIQGSAKSNLITAPNKTTSLTLSDIGIGIVGDPTSFNNFTQIFGGAGGTTVIHFPNGTILTLNSSTSATWTINGVDMTFTDAQFENYIIAADALTTQSAITASTSSTTTNSTNNTSPQQNSSTTSQVFSATATTLQNLTQAVSAQNQAELQSTQYSTQGACGM